MALDPKKHPWRTTLRDIARAVGVSHVTVSLALRNDPRVSVARREEIQAVAERLGYRPDPMLSSLAAYRQGMKPATIRSAVAWLNQWPNPKSLRKLHEFDNYWVGAQEVADRLGYRLEEFVINPGLSGARLQRILLTRNIRGILLPPHSHGFSLTGLDWNLFSLVRFGASITNPRAHIVTSDQTKCAAMAYARAYKRGYRRIGYVSSQAFDLNTKGNFRAGYLSGEAEHLRTRDFIPPLYLEENAGEVSVTLFKRWLKASKPDAIITNLSTLYDVIRISKLEVPGDIAVAATSLVDGGFDSGVDQNSTEVGRVAMSTLASLIQQGERGVPEYCRRILVEGRWVDGESLPWKGTPS